MWERNPSRSSTTAEAQEGQGAIQTEVLLGFLSYNVSVRREGGDRPSVPMAAWSIWTCLVVAAFVNTVVPGRCGFSDAAHICSVPSSSMFLFVSIP